MKLPERTHLKSGHTYACLVSCACECDRFRCVPVLPSFIKERKLQICPALMDFDFNLHSFCLPPSQYFPFAQLATLFKVLQNASRCGRQRSLISGGIYAATAGKVAKFQFRLLLLRLLLSLPQNANDYKIARKLPVNVQHLWPRRV